MKMYAPTTSLLQPMVLKHRSGTSSKTSLQQPVSLLKSRSYNRTAKRAKGQSLTRKASAKPDIKKSSKLCKARSLKVVASLVCFSNRVLDTLIEEHASLATPVSFKTWKKTRKNTVLI